MNSKRLPGKNLFPFNGTTLLGNVCNISLNSKYINEHYVFSSSSYLVDKIPSKVKFLPRDSKFDEDISTMNDILFNFSSLIKADIYVLLHATAPFIKTSSIDKGIESLLTENYDSALSVIKLKEFLWNKSSPINYNPLKIPRTQDLSGYFIETCGFYIFKSDVIQNRKTRIGLLPNLIEVEEIEAVDIDNKIDYQFAIELNKDINKI